MRAAPVLVCGPMRVFTTTGWKFHSSSGASKALDNQGSQPQKLLATCRKQRKLTKEIKNIAY